MCAIRWGFYISVANPALLSSSFNRVNSTWGTLASPLLLSPEPERWMDLERRSVSCLSLPRSLFPSVLLLQPCFSSLILTKRAHQHPAAAPPSREIALSRWVCWAHFFLLLGDLPPQRNVVRMKSRNRPIRRDRPSSSSFLFRLFFLLSSSLFVSFF